jgi:ATP phosphoribosyltransferase
MWQEDRQMGDRPRIALPHKGVLAPGSRQLLAAARYNCAAPRHRLFCADPDNNVEFVYLRARDVPPLVAEGLIDVGITGRDFVAESGCDLVELLPLGFGRSTVRYAVPNGADSTLEDLQGKRIATALPALVSRHLAANGLRAQVIALTGAVENAVHIGVADAVADVVESGRTLAMHGLRAIGPPLVVSEAVLVCSPTVSSHPSVRCLTERLSDSLCATG